ncbi:MAG: amidohydrolase family protein, partial [Candidimonas sp.]
HMGFTPVCGTDMALQKPYLLDEVGQRFPKLKVVICHLGYPYAEEAMGVVARHANFHADLSALGFHHPRKVYQIIHDFGCVNSWDRLLYGSENPFMSTFHKTILSINDVADEIGMPRLPIEAIEKIVGGNACRLYGIDPASVARR